MKIRVDFRNFSSLLDRDRPILHRIWGKFSIFYRRERVHLIQDQVIGAVTCRPIPNRKNPRMVMKIINLGHKFIEGALRSKGSSSFLAFYSKLFK
ncbi:MAG: hypothetical protein ACTSWY_08155 [Promethearchaeota archaeon]